VDDRGSAAPRLLLLIVLAVVIVVLVPPLVKGSLAVVAGVLGSIWALLLRIGKVRPGAFWSGERPLGILLLSIGLLGFGLDFLFEAFALELPLTSPWSVILLIMIACLPLGLMIEWRARSARRSSRHEG
jgi:hypothetical protein